VRNPTTVGRRGLRLALATTGVLLAAACAGDGIDAVPAAGQAPATQSAAPAERPDVPSWDLAAANAQAWTGTATYDLRSRDGAQATVTVTRAADKVRVDVATDGLTSSVLSADAGWVACAVDDRTTCLTVAAPGAELPAAWDPGVGRLVATVVPELATRERGLYTDGYLVAGGGVAAAACAEVVAPDTGRYCVTDDGLLRRAKFTGGTLTLTDADTAVDAARFTPPANPTPLA
jgi:hypothetical protein